MKELNKTQAYKLDKANGDFYYESEDGAYSVYGTESGFCYLYGADKERAIEKCIELNTNNYK